MFTCAYCGTQLTEHKPNCPNCGAAIKIDPLQAEKNFGREASRSAIYKICAEFQEGGSLYFDDAIKPSRMKNAISNFNIPANEKVIMLYDDTVFSSNNKVGFAICARGIYWKNDWAVETKRTYLSWKEFAGRDIKLEGLYINLGKGDAIGVAGCGSDEAGNKIVEMLKEIQKVLSG